VEVSSKIEQFANTIRVTGWYMSWKDKGKVYDTNNGDNNI
jgi:hypothetical protein